MMEGSQTARNCQKYTRLSGRSAVLVQDTTKTLLLIFAGLEILISATANRRLFALRFGDKFTTPLKGFYWCIHIYAIIIHLNPVVKPRPYMLIRANKHIVFGAGFS
ncbi:hypothetical protein A3C86_03275 [Candidatus Kaiserbacteria bacterium RIFCSPHIGHO2_02_FULL_49_16]|uniref:Uncharacterized protein n=1 Tax=Candidatus Kaiserbacteria bacterium RIFCSPHIGHO2_02_FULL_49_16 TaxID=1798490 RepID=A0A1F6DFH1_9BACT|nr:MAG: hypothetical protein A3C86_03275 [Candidatus Kaiserbacteria bacterium RIFCSPHIGHO2_02_FULL_49_16]